MIKTTHKTHKTNIVDKKAFTTSDIAQISHHSRETIKRCLEKGKIKGYRVGTSGHWRVLPNDLVLFLRSNNIPCPDPAKTGIDLNVLPDIKDWLTFCWEFHRNAESDHIRPETACEHCLVYKVRAINCHALREEVGHKKIHCKHSCEDCGYFRFVPREILSGTLRDLIGPSRISDVVVDWKGGDGWKERRERMLERG